MDKTIFAAGEKDVRKFQEAIAKAVTRSEGSRKIPTSSSACL